MISLNAIVTRLQTFAESHYFIQKFTYGNPDELDIEKLGSYPALHVVYNGADYDDGTKTYNFELYLIDLPDNKLEDVEQRKEIASDAEQCLEDILADIAAGGNVFYLAEDYEVTSSSVLPIYKANSNVIAGALLDISIQVPHDRSACNLPIDGVEPQGGEFAYARRGLLRMLTINGATDVLSVNTIRVPNGTLIDNGNGDVTLTISGAGGGDVSSVNDVEPDLNGNVALDTDDIPEGATNEYYTNARVDARIASASVTDLSDVTNAGSGAIITDAERTKLAGIEAGADVNPTAAEVKTLYESNANTNAFTDAEKTKLAGIEDGAEVNAVTSVNGLTGAITGLATTAYVDTEIGSEESARIAGDSSLQTQINTAAGAIATNAANIATNAADIAALEAADYVNTLNGLSGAVTLSAGSNVTLTQIGNDIEISSSGGGGGGGNAFGTIAVPGQSNIVADSGNDTLNINAGTGIDLATNATTDTLTIAVDATTTDIPEGTNLYHTTTRVNALIAAASVTDLSDVTSAGSGAIITSAERTKLNGIETGAQVNVATDLTHTASALTLRIESSTGSDTILTAASATLAGVMTSSDRTKLDGIEAGAEINPTASEIKTAYESNADTNAYTDAEKSKLAGIAAGAEVNVNADWNATSGDAEILNKPTIPAQFFGVKVTTSTAYPLDSPDAGRYLRFTASTSVSVTIPLDRFQPNDEIVLEQAGTGQVQILAASGVTLNNSSANTNRTAERYAVIALKCVATNVFTLTGERELV